MQVSQFYMKDERASGLQSWARLADPSIPETANLCPVSDDASFRRYFRFDQGAEGRVFVDAPPTHEDNESFIKISRALHQKGLPCPLVLDVDIDLGYLSITDLGDTLYLSAMTNNPEQATQLYDDAMTALVAMQEVHCDLPLYDEAKLRQEMGLFDEWFLLQQLGLEVTDDITTMLSHVQQLLVDNASEQPQRFVHRDYHCRNLMVMSEDVHLPGILDFQDAVIGPVSYDLVSLYKDCYYRFDRKIVIAAVERFKASLLKNGLIERGAPFLRWFDLMGAQRHLKCAGIFSRLNLRDGKPGYLPDIPLVVDYLVEVAALYPELNIFGEWLKTDIQPRLEHPDFQR